MGIGIKLAALPVDPNAADQDELEAALDSANQDIARLTGTDFAAIAGGWDETA